MMTSVGRIDERGYLKGFKRRGYTPQKCILELTANSLDAIDARRAKGWTGEGRIIFTVAADRTIRMSDNGQGMDRVAVENMFALHRENHASDASRGVSGIGAKPALSNLSGDKDMHLLTHKESGEYLKVIVPWEAIHRDGVFTGMIKVMEMTAAEAASFGPNPGTTSVFPYNRTLLELIQNNFKPVGEDNPLSVPLDRIGVVFGSEPVRIEYVHFETPDVVNLLPMYDYFGEDDAAYYTGVSRENIALWYSSAENSYRFIWNGLEITPAGRGLAKDPAPVRTNLIGHVRVGDFSVVSGLRRDDAIFNLAAPCMPGASKDHCNAYNTAHLGEANTIFLAQSKLVRNGQKIGPVPLADTILAHSRAGGLQNCAIQQVQCEVRFNPVSAQSNHQDTVMGIQENKNQFDGESLPLTFTRLVKAIRFKKAADIWAYFQQAVAAAAPPPPPAPAPASVDDEEEEEDDASTVSYSSSNSCSASASALVVSPVAPAPAPVPAELESEDELDPSSDKTGTPAPVSASVVNGPTIHARLSVLLSRIDSTFHYSTNVMASLTTLESLLT